MKQLLISLLVFSLIGCDQKTPSDASKEAEEKVRTTATKQSGWRAVAVADLSDAQKSQQELAKKAQGTLAPKLVETLMAAIGEGGPTKGVTACKSNASPLVTAVAKEHNVKIGRTSHKLRNPANVGPEWMKSINDGEQKKPTIFVGPNEELGVASPIITAEVCTQCHGTDEQLADGISDILATEYPEDKARGFATGDLRGWFWVEVPPADLNNNPFNRKIHVFSNTVRVHPFARFFRRGVRR